ncbi:MAG: SMC family ATPase, partial [bacterium]
MQGAVSAPRRETAAYGDTALQLRGERMIITSLRARNFMRFRSFELTGMPQDGIIGIFGDNECGKSSIGEMICFAIFGHTPKAPDGAHSRLVSWGNNESQVELTFRSGDGSFQIVRSLRSDGSSSASLSTMPDGSIIAADNDTIAKEIERILGYGFREFRYSAYIGQKELDIILRSTEDRRLVLNNMLGVGFMETMAKKIVEKRKYYEIEFRMHQRRIHDKEEVLDVYLSRRKDLQTALGRRDNLQRELVSTIREREHISSTISLLEEIKRKKEQYDILDLRIKNRREHLRSIETDISKLMRDADSIPRLLQDNKEKENLINEIHATLMAKAEENLHKVERYRELKRKMQDREDFLRAKEKSLKEITNRLSDIELKEKERDELQRRTNDLDYYIASFPDENKFRIICSHLMKDVELVQSELDRVRTALRSEHQMLNEKERSYAEQMSRIERQRETVGVEAVDQDEVLRMEGQSHTLSRRRDVSLAAGAFSLTSGLALAIFFSNPVFLAILALLAPVTFFTFYFQSRLYAVRQKLHRIQQQYYAYNITQRGLQELQDTTDDLMEGIKEIAEQREKLQKRIQVLSYLKCEDFNQVESSIEEMKKLDEPDLVRAIDL